MQSKIEISNQFKNITIKAILSIVLFIIVYLSLIFLAIGFTILTGFGGIMLIITKPAIWSLMIGAGIISMGLLILIFLIKFLFKKHEVDRSDLIEITKENEPYIFELIAKIVKEANTDFPKRIYLCPDVNAAVFYDSSFWSMFFPIRKNLMIGLGLVNSVSINELKAILAHEFGHFSQRSMKVGSYVYNVNQIIYNMLYDNESYDSLVYKWSSINGYFTFFVGIAVKIVQGIQSILKVVYEIININYMSLSREMEFHADEVAANIAGSEPLITSLMRLDLANHCYTTILNYYNEKIAESKVTKNIYSQQKFVLNFLANEHMLPLENDVPIITLDYLNRYNKSKLNIADQWASHPSTKDRVQKLELLNIKTNENSNVTISKLLNNTYELQTKMTEMLFSSINYVSPTLNIDDALFIEDFKNQYKSNTFSKIFNSYYDSKNPSIFDFDEIQIDSRSSNIKFEELYSNDKVDFIYTLLALENDILLIKHISDKNIKIKSFDYDGIRYSAKEIDVLLPKLEDELEELNRKILENDINIYKYFLLLATNIGKQKELKDNYQKFASIESEQKSKLEIYNRIVNATSFIYQTTPFEIIEQNMLILKDLEEEFKNEVKHILDSEIFQPEFTSEIKEQLLNYFGKKMLYFNVDEYYKDELNVLFNSIENFRLIVTNSHFKIKKELLFNFEKLLKENKRY